MSVSPAGPTGADAPHRLDLARSLRLLSGAFLVVWAYSWWLLGAETAIAPVMSLTSLTAALAVMAVAAGRHRPDVWRRVDRVIFVAVMVIGLSWLAVEAGTHPYTSDEVAIGQAAATSLLSGSNPYTHDLAPNLHQFDLSPRQATPLLDGGSVHTATYPALSFLLSAPFGILLGRGGHYAQAADVLAWGATLLLLWRLLPATVHPLLPILASASFFVTLVSGGNTDSLFLPMLCVALWRWHRYGAADERSAARWAGPVALGLACAVKQTPWLLAPFLVAGVALEARRRGARWPHIAGRYTAVAAAAFALPNLPFLVADPAAWTHGVLLPLAQPLIPFGQGLVQVVASGIGGGRLGLYTAAALAAEVAALLAFIALHPRSRTLLPVAAVVPLVLSTRSLPNYFVAILPPLLVGVATVPWSPEPPMERVRRWLLGAVATTTSLTVAVAAVAVASPAPLRLTGVSGQTGAGPDGRPLTRLEVRVHNGSGGSVHPSFVSLDGVEWVGGWRTVRGPDRLGPGAEAAYVLESTDPRIAIDPGNTFAVAALVARPASVSVSSRTTVTASSNGAAPIP